MVDHPLRERAAIVGVGHTGFSKHSGVTTHTLAARAVLAALDDAGVAPKDVDGVVCHRVGDSVVPAVVAQTVGIGEVHYHLDVFGGGGNSSAAVAYAAMAVATGTAEVVVVWRALNARSGRRMGGTGEAATDALDFQFQAPYGLYAPPQLYAMVARAFMERHGLGEEDLGAVAVTERQHAVLNERAMQRQPITMEDYLASRWVAEPLRLLDCCLETDAAVALVVTTAERARDLRRPPVLIRGVGISGGHTLYNQRAGADFATSGAAVLAPRLWSTSGTSPTEVDVAELYDAYTPMVPMQLGDYGLCAREEVSAFLQAGEHGPGGRLPVNTHGGHLSEGYAHGLNHVAEAVIQLRCEAGVRQVPGAEVALVTGAPGYISGVTSALVLRGAR